MPIKMTNPLDINKKMLVKTIKIMLFTLFFIMVVTVIFRSRSHRLFVGTLGLATVLLYAINLFFRGSPILTLVLYILKLVALSVMAFAVRDTFISTLYIIVLSDFYLSSSFKKSAYMGIFSFVGYILAIVLSKVRAIDDLPELYTRLLQDLIVFTLDFVIVTLSVTVLRRNLEIEKSLEIVNKREQKLKEAYDKLEEVTILEERNRIAKEIHDTAGHSITTIIMQTEAAKLIIDKNPLDAKNKIISANLQAVTALEELRQSVKMLSGVEPNFDLMSAIEKALEDTTAGTDIVIRRRIDNIKLPDAIARFIYSTLKEGLNNGIRHGKSTAFFVELKKTAAGVSFLLSDNGKGVNLRKLESGFGLKSMREKAKQLGGSIYFVSEQGEGFEIHINFDLKEKSDD